MNAISFLSGISVATFMGSSLFFFKFWKTSRDRFFLFFAGACVLLALDRFIALFFHATQEPLRSADTEAISWVYLVRLLAFVVIAAGILDRNRTSKKQQ